MTALIIIQATIAAMVWIGAIYIGITGKPITINWPKK